MKKNMEKEGKVSLCVFATPAYSYTYFPTQTSLCSLQDVLGKRKAIRCCRDQPLALRAKSRVLLEISFRAHPSSHPQLFIVGLPLYLPKVLDSLWRGDISSVSPHLQKELWHFCNLTHQEDSFKLTFITPNQNTAEKATQGCRKGQALALDWNLLCKEFDGPI